MKSKKTSQEEAKEMLGQMAKELMDTSEHFSESVVGRAAISLLREKPSITGQDLKEWIERAIALTPSAQGRGNPKLDMDRLCLEAGLQSLEAALSHTKVPRG